MNTNGVYSLEANDLSMTNKLKSLYLDKDYVLGGKFEKNGRDVRLIISEEAFNFVFNPKKIVAENTSAELQIWFVRAGGSGTEVYFNDKLIVPDLGNYNLVQSFEDENTEVWVKKELVRESYVDAIKAENFIYENFPQHSIYSFAELDGGTPIIQDYTKEKTKIDTQFRDNLKFAVYAEGSLNIEFTKRDLNSYVGKDEYTVEIKDFQGKEYFKEVYEDDGEKKDTGKCEEEQDFEISLDNLPRNIYYVSFVKDKNNRGSDSTIKNIKINSNKVLIVGDSLPWSNFNFYTEVSSSKKVDFYYWWENKAQKIKIIGSESKIIDLDEPWLNKKYEEEFEAGEYYFDIPKGYLWIRGSDAISPSKENWFYFPQNSDKKLINSDIIIIDKNKLEINGDDVVYTERLKVNEDSKFKFQVLDKTQIYFEKIKLVLDGENWDSDLRVL